MFAVYIANAGFYRSLSGAVAICYFSRAGVLMDKRPFDARSAFYIAEGISFDRERDQCFAYIYDGSNVFPAKTIIQEHGSYR